MSFRRLSLVLSVIAGGVLFVWWLRPITNADNDRRPAPVAKAPSTKPADAVVPAQRAEATAAVGAEIPVGRRPI